MTTYTLLLTLVLGPVHASQTSSGYASSENFVVYAPDQELADEVMERAESLRTKIAIAWLGRELPKGVGRSLIHVKVSQTEQMALTWPKDHPKKHFHRVTIVASRDTIVGHTLAHEITHVVMATAFEGKLPRWADEGVATFQNEDRRLEGYRETLGGFARSATWPTLQKILDQDGIGSDERNFYPVANSLTEFLIERKSADDFFHFALDGKEKGWEFAVRKHYELPSIQALEFAWHDWINLRLNQHRRLKTANLAVGHAQQARSRGEINTATSRLAPAAK